MLELVCDKKKKKKVQVVFETSVVEREELKEIARNQGLSLSDFIKYCINYTVDKEGLMYDVEDE